MGSSLNHTQDKVLQSREPVSKPRAHMADQNSRSLHSLPHRLLIQHEVMSFPMKRYLKNVCDTSCWRTLSFSCSNYVTLLESQAHCVCYWVPSELSQHASVPGGLSIGSRRNILVELFTLSLLLESFPKIDLLITKLANKAACRFSWS